jgi:hypothetical protein
MVDDDAWSIPMGCGLSRIRARGVERFGGAIPMRFASLLVTTLSPVMMLPTLPHAATSSAPAPAPRIETGSVETNDTARPRCSRHSRYGEGYQSKDGRWIKGYCTPLGHH